MDNNLKLIITEKFVTEQRMNRQTNLDSERSAINLI